MRIENYIVVLVAALLMGCVAPKLNADYTIRPWVQHQERGRVDSLYGLVGYAVEADTADWTVTSYEDALAGRLTSRWSDESREAQVEALVDGQGWSLKFHFTRKPVIIVVADPEREFYAWHQAVIYGGTPATFLSLTEQAWRADTILRQGVWTTAYGIRIEN